MHNDRSMNGTSAGSTRGPVVARGSGWELTGSDLKWIALVTMILDHIGVALLDPASVSYWCVRLIGRLAFPLYCFLLVEGFCHTRNVGNYLRRLLMFAVISEIPFDMMHGAIPLTTGWFRAEVGNGIEGVANILTVVMSHQNVYFTLAIGLIALMGYVHLNNQNQPMYAIVWCAIMSGAAWLLRADYDFAGVILICILYRFRQEPQMRALWGGGTLLLAMSPMEFPALLDFGLMSLYGGKRGDDRWRWLFYAAYPVHLLVLGVLRILL